MTLKVWWFPEYSPSQQQVFDDIVSIIKQAYTKYGYMHIETPAVERSEILLKWWENASKEIFGLYGMASWIEDIKGYGLNFDLTIPFARYVLDHQGSLIFPFKRYQIQDCWRWERPQRWRFRQFKQADIDAIWRQDDWAVKYLLYDAEIIVLLRETLELIRTKYLAKKAITTHINNRNILWWLFSAVTWEDPVTMQKLSKLFDSFYKLQQTEFDEQLQTILSWSSYETVKQFLSLWLDNLDEKFIQHPLFIQWVSELKEVFVHLHLMWSDVWTRYVYDPFIVRWLDYYTWTVFENLIAWEYELWSICSWWRYANLTQSLDPHSAQFDWVWWSIWISRIFSLVQEHITALSTRKNWVILLHFAETLPEIIRLWNHLKQKNIAVDIFPWPDKLSKQFQYADKHNIKHVILLWPWELQEWVYQIKEMKSGDTLKKTLPRLEA